MDFTAEYATNYGAIVGFVRKRTGNHEDAEDIAQDAFLSAWQKWDRCKNAGYVYTAAANRTIDLARRRRDGRSDLPPGAFVREPEDALKHHQDDTTPEEAVIAQETAGLLLARLDVLSGMERRVMRLFCGGATCQEIAAELGRSVSGVKSAIYRAHRRLAGRPTAPQANR